MTTTHYFEVRSIAMSFGGLRVLDDVSFAVEQGEIVGLIGPNGAGKTTLFDIISGFREPSAGRVLFKGDNLIDEKPFRRAWLGIGRTFQTARLFQNETVLDTVRTACHRRIVDGATRTLLSGVFGTRRSVQR
jgi:branched-chain amino acid transport system ATP-binding protein